MSNLIPRRRAATRFLAFLALILLGSTLVPAQSTVGTGSIQGSVTDQTGAVVSGAKVTITNQATGAAIHLTASSAGT
jgi:hypothetical protein